MTASAGGTTVACSTGCAESVEFANPTTSLNINLGSGGQTITVTSTGAGFAATFTVNGGAGRDTLIFPAAAYTAATDNFTGPNAGSVNRDGTIVSYTAVELVQDLSTAPTHTVNFTDGADSIRVTRSGDAGDTWVQPTVAGAFATVEIANPASFLNINTLGGNDSILVDSFDAAFPATVSIDAGAGDDSITIAVPVTLAGMVNVDGGDGLDSLADFTLVSAAHVANIEVVPTGLPALSDQGPGPMSPTFATDPTFLPAVGAVQALAMDPQNSSIIFAGTVAGGIWVSEDAGVTWTPKSDQLPSLAISSITVSPRTRTGALVTNATLRTDLVVYAGTGQVSSSWHGGLGIGVLRSLDGGDTWTVLSPITLQGTKVNSVVVLDNPATPTILPDNEVVVISATTDATPGGIYRSTDGGLTFTKKVSGSGTDLVGDPGKAGRAYAALSADGVYRTDDYGDTWGTAIVAGLDLTADNIDNNGDGVLGDPNEGALGAARIILAIQQNIHSETNSVYAALLSAAPHAILMGVFTATPTADAGNPLGNWSLLGDTAAHPVTASPPVHATLHVVATTGLEFGANAAGTPSPDPELTISRADGDWRAEGFAPGQLITISGATAANNGTFTVAAVTEFDLTIVAPTALFAFANIAGPAGTAITVVPFAPSPLSDSQPQPMLGEQANVHFAMVADGAGNVFIAGDVGLQSSGYSGNIYLFTASSSVWTQLVDQTAGPGVRPHADSRELILDLTGAAGSADADAGELWTGNDGGVYKLTLSGTRAWSDMNGNAATGLRITELLSLAYDPLNAVFLGGSQDNGVGFQPPSVSDGLDSNGNGLIDDPAERAAWQSLITGDGNTLAVIPINETGAGVNVVLYYVLLNNLKIFYVAYVDNAGHRLAYVSPALKSKTDAGLVVTVNTGTDVWSTATNNPLTQGAGPVLLRNSGNTVLPGGVNPGTLPSGARADTEYWVEFIDHQNFKLHVGSIDGAVLHVTTTGTGTLTLVKQFGGLTTADRTTFTDGFRDIPYVVNSLDPTMMMMGLGNLYTSTDRLETVKALPAQGNTVYFTSIAYGGTKGATQKKEVFYATAGNTVYIGTPIQAGHAQVIRKEQIAGVTTINQVVMDPRNYDIAYVTTNAGVYMRSAGDIDHAGTWTLISQNLLNAGLEAVSFIPKESLTFAATDAPQDVLLVGGDLGVFRAFAPAAGSSWTELGTNVPNAPVRSIQFIAPNYANYVGRRALPTDPLLIVATQGRGAWTLTEANVTLAEPSVLTINGTDAIETVVVSRNAANASLLEVTLNGRTILSTSVFSVARINFNGGLGNDSLTVDSTNGSISLSGGVHFVGGGGADTLTLRGGDVHAFDSTGNTYTVTDVVGGAQERVFFEDLTPGDGDTTDLSGLHTAPTWLQVIDSFTRWYSGFQPPSNSPLAVLGATLPRVISGATNAPPTAIGDPPDNEALAEEGDVAAEATNGEAGLSRLFTFPDGSTLLDKVRDGTIHDLATLEAALADLGTVTGPGPDPDAPVFNLTLTKNLAGDAGFDVGFDQFGGHVQLSGDVHASADVAVDLTFGYNATDGFYIQTDGATPEVSVSNIVVTGDVNGVGQLGFLGIALDQATLTFNSVTVGFDVGSPTGDGKIHFSDLFDLDALAAHTSISVVGSADLQAGARVLAFGGDDAEPFELAGATLNVHWADLTQPTNVVVTFTGGLADTLASFLKVRVDEILSKLTALRDGMAALGVGNVPYLSSGLSSVISVLQVLDDNTVSAGGIDAPSFLTAQDFADRLEQQLGLDAGVSVSVCPARRSPGRSPSTGRSSTPAALASPTFRVRSTTCT